MEKSLTNEKDKGNIARSKQKKACIVKNQKDVQRNKKVPSGAFFYFRVIPYWT